MTIKAEDEMVKQIEEMKKIKETQKKQLEEQKKQLNSAKSELISNLEKLIIKSPYTNNLPEMSQRKIQESDYSSINQGIELVINLVKDINDLDTTQYLLTINERTKILSEDIHNFLEAEEIEKYLKNNRMAYSEITNIHNALNNYLSIKEQFSRYTFDAINNSLIDVEKELTKFKRLRGIADTALTESIYDRATKNFSNQAKINKVLFIGTLLLIAYIATVFEYPKDLTLGFWMPKITLSLIGITLVTYFLKQSSHYQKLADQSYQTQVELQALPSFIANISNHESAELIRKELALKYFGKDVDGTPHKDLSNLITDQMKSTTELVKATTNILKKP